MRTRDLSSRFLARRALDLWPCLSRSLLRYCCIPRAAGSWDLSWLSLLLSSRSSLLVIYQSWCWIISARWDSPFAKSSNRPSHYWRIIGVGGRGLSCSAKQLLWELNWTSFIYFTFFFKSIAAADVTAFYAVPDCAPADRVFLGDQS